MDAVEAAVAVARDHGVVAASPGILHSGTSTVVHLAPAAVVARVSTGRRAQVEREVDVAAHAALRGAPVVPPSTRLPPGPHDRGGWTITFFDHVEERGDRDGAAIGRSLRALHDALADYDGPLPGAGHTAEILGLLDALPAEYEFMHAIPDPRLPGQALHGDAHLRNTIPTASGPLWTDFDCACRGPREADLACLLLRERVHGWNGGIREALAAYGPYDEELVEAYVPLQVRYVTVWVLLIAQSRPDWLPLARERVEWLRRYA